MDRLFCEKNKVREMGSQFYLSVWSSILYYSCLFSLFQTPNGNVVTSSSASNQR